MLWILASLLAALGLHVFLARRSLASWLVGGQLIFLSLATFFVHAGLARGDRSETSTGALHIVILAAVFLGVILGLAVRQFLLSRDVRADRMEAE